MGLLDITPKENNTLITRSMITSSQYLDFTPMISYPTTHFRKNIYSGLSKNIRFHCVAFIKVPKNFQEGEKVEISLTFMNSIYWCDIRQRYYGYAGAAIPQMTFKSNLYEYIQMFLSEENIMNHLISNLKSQNLID